MLVDLETFSVMTFPKQRDIVYVLCYKCKETNKVCPFYIGESSRNVGRIGDYLSARFTAATDFKVGEAIRYLQFEGYEVEIKFKDSSDRKAEEKALIINLRKSYILLNDLNGYDYRTANESEERSRIRAFIDKIINQNTSRKPDMIFEDETPNQTNNANLTIPERVKIICQELDALYETSKPSHERIIFRKDILRIAAKQGIKPRSATIADYCDNGETSKHSRHSFLHFIKPGRYILNINHKR